MGWGSTADTPILSALLARAGFATHYVGNNDFAMSRFKQVGKWASFETPYYAHGKDCAPIVERALAHATAAQAAGKRFFVSLLPIEPHVAYRFHGSAPRRSTGLHSVGNIMLRSRNAKIRAFSSAPLLLSVII